MKCSVEPEIEDFAPVAYKSLIPVLKKKGYSVSLYRVRKKIKKKRSQYLKYPVINEDVVKSMNLLVVFSPYATSHKARRFSKSHRVPMLHLEKGFLPKSTLCDIQGFWGESIIFRSIKKHLDELMNDRVYCWADDYRQYLSSNNISKRKQPDTHTPLPKKFIFLPMQYMNDQSVLKFGNMPYASFVKRVAKFCSDRSITLAIKKHPHAYLKETKQVNRLFKAMTKRFGKVFAPIDGSIHWFCKNCLFMAGMNTGSIIDGLVNHSIISHCGKSIFMRSGAVIHDDDVYRGLEKCLSLSKEDKDHMKLRQKALVYYLYNRYLLLEEDTHGSELSNRDKINVQLELVKKVSWK